MDLATLTAAPRDVDLAGRRYRVAPLTAAQWGILHSFLKQYGAGPLAALKSADLEGLSPADRRELFTLALLDSRSWPPAIASGAWFAAMGDCPGGSARFVFLALSRLNPEVSEDVAKGISEADDPEGHRALLFAAIGLDLPPKSSPPPPAVPDAEPSPEPGKVMPMATPATSGATTGPRCSTS